MLMNVVLRVFIDWCKLRANPNGCLIGCPLNCLPFRWFWVDNTRRHEWRKICFVFKHGILGFGEQPRRAVVLEDLTYFVAAEFKMFSVMN